MPQCSSPPHLPSHHHNMTEEFDFVDSTPSAVPLKEENLFSTGDDEHVEETVEEIVEGEDVDVGVDGEHVTIHEEIIDTPIGGDFSTTHLGGSTSSQSGGFNSFQPSPLRYALTLNQLDASTLHYHFIIIHCTSVLIFLYREYQTKHEEYLREKATKSHEKHQALLDKAKSDIDNFYKERALKRDKSEASNRYACVACVVCWC